MTTWTALATLPGEAPARRLADAMERMAPEPSGVGVFEMEDGSGLWEVGGYFEDRPDPAGLALIEAVFGVRLVVSELPETDWVAKVRRELSPVEAGRFLVHGAHDADRAAAARAEGRETLLIEAAMAFGTGHHGTTLGCLLAFDGLLAAGERPASVLDIGCGTAVLAMAAARMLPGAAVLATDIDPVAIEVAEANLDANGLANRVDTAAAAGTDHPLVQDGAPWSLVFANILMGPLIALAPDIAAVTAPGGTVILSGLLQDQAFDVSAAYTGCGFDVAPPRVHGDWAVLIARKTSA